MSHPGCFEARAVRRGAVLSLGFRSGVLLSAVVAWLSLAPGNSWAQTGDAGPSPEQTPTAPAAAPKKEAPPTAVEETPEQSPRPERTPAPGAEARPAEREASPPPAPEEGVLDASNVPAVDDQGDAEAPEPPHAIVGDPIPISEEPNEPEEVAPPERVAEAPPAAPAEAEAAAPEPVPVRVGGRNVYQIRAPQGTKSLEERARSAEQAIRKAVESETPESVRVESLGDAKVIYAGAIPLLHLTAEDATAAGDVSLGVHADRIAAELRDVIATEQKRSAIASTIFGVSLAALLTLAALLLLRKTSEFTARVRNWVSAHREHIPGIRLQSLEVVDAATIRSAVALGVEVSKWLLRIGIVYLWLLLTLSLFESTREYTENLTGVVVTPLSSFMTRIATSLPVLVVAMIAAAAFAVLVRFVDLFFAGVARGETKLAWLPPDLAPATSVLLRVAIVVGALVFAAPVVTGDAEGSLSKIGIIALGALGLAVVPVVASGLTGAGVLFGRRLRVGDFVELGGLSGRVLAVDLLEVRLEDGDGAELRVPHLLSFVHGTRVLGARPRTSLELCVADHGKQACEILRGAIAKVGDRPRVEVLAVEPDYVRYRVSVTSTRPDVRNELFFAASGALREAGITLGQEAQASVSGVA